MGKLFPAMRDRLYTFCPARAGFGFAELPSVGWLRRAPFGRLASPSSLRSVRRGVYPALEKEHLYKRRQEIVEHPYGTIKRQWGFSYILKKKGIKRASSDVGFMFIAYNLRRIANTLTPEMLKEYLRMLTSALSSIIDLIRSISLSSERRLFLNINLPVNYCLPLKHAKSASVPVNSDRLLNKLPLATRQPATRAF